MVPDGAGDHDNGPVQGAEEEALDRVPVLVYPQRGALLAAEKEEDPQRQPAPAFRQIGDDAVEEPLPAGRTAAQEHQQASQIDRQPPGELKEVKARPGPAGGGDCSPLAAFRRIHAQNLISFDGL